MALVVMVGKAYVGVLVVDYPNLAGKARKAVGSDQWAVVRDRRQASGCA